VDDLQPNHERKAGGGVWLTHKHLAYSGIVSAVLFAIQPTLTHFSTKDETNAHLETVQVQLTAQAKQLDDIQQLVKDLNLSIQDREKQSEARQRFIDDRQDRQIESLEASRLSGRKTSNN
jgi:septal ring factor EnvC (AmiA/AmiB activator)